MDGKLHTYKARLVAKGYTQTHRIDYEETLSPVAKIKSIRIMLSIDAFHDYEIWQIDVNIAFLNRKLIEDAMTCTRPDVSFTLSMVSRYQQNPGEGHWIAVKNILKYLRNTKDMFLVYGGEEELIVTRAVTWKSLKQNTVADSICESEYICEASKEAIWIKNFIGDLGVVPTVQNPIEIFCDNESVVSLTKEPKDHIKSKHIERKYHFVRSKVKERHMIVKHIRSEDNPADPFTKALAKSRHDEHARSIGLKDNIKF
ncbi:retrotransposon protein, putative, ty1-copia subclass [Tanacetum coccineum]